MQLLSKCNKGIRFLLCVIDIFSKYAWVAPLKDKKGISIVKAFQSILKQSNRKPNKIWIDKESEFYNAYFKKWSRDNDIVMYSTHNEGKSVVAERFIRTLKSKIYKYMTSISKNVYIDKLDDVVDEYNNTYHTTIKMKPIDVKDNMSQYYPPYKSSSNNIKVELDLSNYATKDDVKNITHVDVSSYATKTNLAVLKTEVDKIDTDKLKTVPDDLAKLSNVVKNEVVKKTDFRADDYVKKTKFSGDINSLDDKIDKVEKKIPDVSSLETKRNVTTLIKNLNDRIDNLKIKEYAKNTS